MISTTRRVATKPRSVRRGLSLEGRILEADGPEAPDPGTMAGASGSLVVKMILLYWSVAQIGRPG